MKDSTVAYIYLSSTYSDLKNEREQVRLALQKLGHQLVSMETYTASEERPLDVCLADVAKCDLYIGILAWRYGYIPPTYDKSITELEYRKAIEAGKPCLWFLIDENANWSRAKMEIPASERIQRLRNEIKESHTVSEFTDVVDLVSKVIQAVVRWQSRTSAPLDENVEWTRFEETFRAQLVLRHGVLVSPIYGSARPKVPLDALYVAPNLVSQNTKQPLELVDFLKKTERVVVLGQPGGGKSTLANKICVDLASGQADTASAPVPFLIVLREYETYQKTIGGTILEFTSNVKWKRFGGQRQSHGQASA